MIYQTRKDTKKVKLTVTYNMVWHNISYGRRYESSNGHDFVIGGIYKSVIGVVLYSKALQKCDATYNMG